MNKDVSFFLTTEQSRLNIHEAPLGREKSMYEIEAQNYFLRSLDPSYYNKIDFDYIKKLFVSKEIWPLLIINSHQILLILLLKL